MLKTTVPYLILLLVFSAIKANVADARRSYPSIFQAWSGIENRPDTDELHQLAEHDLAFAHPYTLLRIAWNISEAQPYSGLANAGKFRATIDVYPEEPSPLDHPIRKTENTVLTCHMAGAIDHASTLGIWL